LNNFYPIYIFLLIIIHDNITIKSMIGSNMPIAAEKSIETL